MKTKFCGLRRLEDVAYVNEVKPDFAGFILAKGFRRSISREEMIQLKAKLDPEIQAVGVFVNPDPGEVIGYLEEGLIDVAQLHGEESEEDIVYIKAVTGKPVIKAVRAENRFLVEAWLDTAADFLLFDSGTGSGETFDWGILQDIDRDFFLAGGLNAENLEQAVTSCRPYGVDVSSGIETDGVKDLEKMHGVAQTIKRIERNLT